MSKYSNGCRLIESSSLVLPGMQVLWLDGRAVWFGALGAPTEDVHCDKVTISPHDYEELKDLTKPITLR